ncbi:hypothetical protein [Streptomyces phaeoluteigriseus]|nr:hypothetical protein [Streptomyces phaeoluteigriseus]
MAAAVLSGVLGIPWKARVLDYETHLYRLDEYPDAEGYDTVA